MKTIQFKYVRSEYVKALRFFLVRQWLTTRNLLMWVPLIAFFTYLWHDDGTSYVTTLIAIIAIFSGVIGVLVFFLQPFFFIKRNASFTSEHTVTFSDDEVSLRNELIDSKLRWGLFNKVLENKDAYILSGKSNLLIIPKLAFANEEARMEVESLFRKKLG